MTSINAPENPMPAPDGVWSFDKQNVIAASRRIMRRCEIMKLDAKATGNRTRADDADEIRALADSILRALGAVYPK